MQKRNQEESNLIHRIQLLSKRAMNTKMESPSSNSSFEVKTKQFKINVNLFIYN